MKTNSTQEIKEGLFLDEFDEQYLKSDNKAELDYWAPLSKIIMESILIRDLNGMSQSDLAIAMKTKQSVISRFENLGRVPNYDFIARLSLSLGHVPGMTLCGDFMAVVPIDKQNIIRELAEKENTSTREYVQEILNQGIVCKTNTYNEIYNKASDATSGIISEFDIKGNNILQQQEILKEQYLNQYPLITSSHQDDLRLAS